MKETICKNCGLWNTEDKKPYCVMKDLYTETKPDHQCDEVMINGKTYFIAKKDVTENGN